jgi:hypothetical protein
MPLTDEDKNWIATTVQTSEERMATEIRASEERTANLVATQIRASEERTAHLIAGEIGTNHIVTQAAIKAVVDEIDRRIEASENRLLIAFHQWASPLDIKVRAHSMAIGAFDGEKENSIEQARKLEELRRTTAELKARVENLEQRFPKAS